MDATVEAGQRQFPCKQCGAALQFAPGTHAMVCPYCGTSNEFKPIDASVPLLDYAAYSQQLPEGAQVHETLSVHCDGCGAQTQFPPDVTAGRCPFCSAPVVAERQSTKAIKPAGLLPFAVAKEQAAGSFRKWIASLWFAPSSLAKQAERTGIDGAYIPAWTYDSQTITQYVGERGEDYQEMETYTEFVNGKAETRTRMVTRTRWWPASGVAQNRFHDLLVLATRTLPDKQAQHLQPWDLPSLVPYADEYLAGMACQSYQINLKEGFGFAQQMMAPVIQQTICRDIGGDHQRVLSSQTEYREVGFRHLLLPLWISAYRYGGKTYRFLVNARTGHIQGQRPYSAAKIAALVMAIIAAIGVLVLAMNRAH